MKTLDAATLTELSATVSRPLLLVEIDFSSVIRMSSRSDVSWNGYTWTSQSIKVDGISVDGSGGSACKLTIGNTDNMIGAILLNERIADKAIQVWEAWLDPTNIPRVVSRFTGVGDSFEIGSQSAVINAVAAGTNLRHAPRQMISVAGGFSRLRPEGYKMNWNGVDYTLTRPPQ
jgi:hypothetical protein